MDHARHLSSPSPTSPFLFHHSERSFKSNSLTPLLSSTADVTSVDDCYSTTSSSISHQSHHLNPFGNEQHHSLVDDHHHQHHHHQNHHQRHTHDQCVIDQDSLTGVDDDDGMHNMLSGSSTSSTSTMPLLTESHSHHSFSRISLEEYSPLSLVEDCDNALPISPTSLACGSHHSFKTSLNGLKIDSLVGDVGVNDQNDNEIGHDDARSLSPTLLSSSATNHHNLWSNSSTAITQNTSLLNSTSTSFLLSQHHQNQLNSLIQQLEPQSLDEAPPLITGTTSSNNFDMNSSTTHRPSSEPPPGAGNELSEVESKSLTSQPLQPKLKQTNVKSKNNNNNNSGTPTPLSTSALSGKSKRTRNRSSASRQPSNCGNIKNLNSEKKLNITNNSSSPALQQPAHNSKLHLQLNHHKKLQELQKRLFGTASNTVTVDNEKNKAKLSKRDQTASKASTSASSNKSDSTTTDFIMTTKIKEEPDSSAYSKEEDSEVVAECNQAKNVTRTSNSSTIKTRSRPSRSRRSRAIKVETCHPSSSSTQAKSVQKIVAPETVEPDTTTRSSDSIKLADLLSANNSNVDSKSINGFIATNGFNSNQETSDIGEKRVQQIQLQVSPSLTVVANGGLMQPISIQQPFQQSGSGTVITTSGATFASNQILCRPQTVMASTGTNGNQLKGVMSNSELLKSGETILSNWSVQANNNSGNNNSNNNNSNGGNNNNNNNATNNTQTIGAHQIAIQVICQDGTSLVLPVSSAAGLSAAVSLTSQHQQLQAVLANQQQQQRNQTTNQQVLPLMSVSNIVAQQQMATNSVENGTTNSNSSSSTSQTSAGTQTTSGLAASSPTLAALLDAGSNTRINNDVNNGNFTGQNFVSTNLLRKLVSAHPNEQLKRGESGLQGLSLTNCGSLMTVSASNGKVNSSQSNKNNASDSATGEKRLKFDNNNCNINNMTNIQATGFTLIDSQGLVVANSNAEKANKQSATSSSGSNVSPVQQQTNTLGQSKVTNPDATSKNTKMGSSTGNRQVDPTQPFRCEHCNSTFTRLGNFTRHKKIHTVPTKVCTETSYYYILFLNLVNAP